MVDGYCLDVIPCKIWKSYFEKQLSYGQYMEIWFGFVDGFLKGLAPLAQTFPQTHSKSKSPSNNEITLHIFFTIFILLRL